MNIFSASYKPFFSALILLSIYQHVFSQQKINFDYNWRFTSIEFTRDNVQKKAGKNWNDQFSTEKVSVIDSSLSAQLPLDNTLEPVKNHEWSDVTLPHVAFPEPLIVNQPREGIAYYKKDFNIPDSLNGKIITLEFEGAMQIAWVWINGSFIKRHLGGYLPFVIDLTHIIKYGRKNTIVVRLDNRSNLQVPPGKPVNHLDFLYYSGLYRDVWLTIQNPLHITNANQIDRAAGGGIFVTYPSVSENKAVVDIKTNVINEFHKGIEFVLKQELYDMEGKLAAITTNENLSIEKGNDKQYHQQLMVTYPALWSPDSPNLYKLYSKVIIGKKVIDEKITKIGIRSIHIDVRHGLLINNKPVRLEGTNRHQSYPWIGNALSDNANYRDAIMIKNAGMNCVRLAHYPQDPSFYDACDSLGILLIDCVPGWQFFNQSATFINNNFSDIRQMIRRDRNHPSILLWETSLNETYPAASFRCKQVEVAKSEWPSGNNFYTSGDSYFTKACYDVPYDDWADNIEARNNTTYPDNPYLIREYGDYEFGGDLSTSRQLRGNGEDGLLQQAWNLQWEHNRNRQMYPRCIGDLNWAFFDGVSGNLSGIKSWGIADIMRIPKFAYYFFQSQKKNAAPMCYIANYWDGKDTSGKVIVYSNCDEIKLLLNGKDIAHQYSDQGPDTPYKTALDKGGHPFDDGNARGLSSPPFTFSNTNYVPGELKAVAYRDGREVTSYVVHTPGKAAKICLEQATQGIPLQANSSDVIFVYAKIVDSAGNLVVNDSSMVHFYINGPAKLISPNLTKAEAGIATVLLQGATKPGLIKLTAESNGLRECIIEVKNLW
ncbi:MAG: glycoside hydrolase family 2 TIM barrel-domain containing protein [Arachidicoccus sp.]|nr:glycoside hydrolase family 2 TIM barrel-domain containing protein [Arachidicoccus sp.]